MYYINRHTYMCDLTFPSSTETHENPLPSSIEDDNKSKKKGSRSSPRLHFSPTSGPQPRIVRGHVFLVPFYLGHFRWVRFTFLADGTTTVRVGVATLDEHLSIVITTGDEVGNLFITHYLSPYWFNCWQYKWGLSSLQGEVCVWVSCSIEGDPTGVGLMFN